MNTPEGWARANLLLATLQAPPPVGTPQEFVMLMLVDKLELIEHAKHRALVQTLIDPESGGKAYEEYTKFAFPGMSLREKQRDEELKKQLKEWIDQGPLAVTPLPTPTIRSRMKTKAVQITKSKRANAFYRKLGDPLGRRA